jgi:pSer/pThr/pTyr-binding forkhead associated (FHA) protein
MSSHVVEVLDRHGRVAARALLADDPITIGRAPSATLVIDDPYTCPAHAQIVPGEPPRLVDLESLNGTYLDGQRARIDAVELSDAHTLKVGHTQLRITRIGAALKPTLIDPLLSSRLYALDRGHFALIAVAALLLTATLFAVLDSSEAEPWLSAFSSQALPIAWLVLAWASGVSLLNRLLADRFRFAGHLTIAALFVWAEVLQDSLIGTLCFALGIDAAQPWLGLALSVGLGLIALYAHLRLISSAPTRSVVQKTALAAALPLALLGFSEWSDQLDDDFDASPDLNILLRHPAASLSDGVASEHWQTQGKTLLDDLERKADTDEP